MSVNMVEFEEMLLAFGKRLEVQIDDLVAETISRHLRALAEERETQKILLLLSPVVLDESPLIPESVVAVTGEVITHQSEYPKSHVGSIPEVSLRAKVLVAQNEERVDSEQVRSQILDHERKRKVEVKSLELEDILEDQGYSKGDIDTKVSDYRIMLVDDEGNKTDSLCKDEFGRIIVSETHQIAEAQQEKNTKLSEAFGISEFVVEGSSFDPMRHVREAQAKAVAQQKIYARVRTRSPAQTEPDTTGQAGAAKTDNAGKKRKGKVGKSFTSLHGKRDKKKKKRKRKRFLSPKWKKKERHTKHRRSASSDASTSSSDVSDASSDESGKAKKKKKKNLKDKRRSRSEKRGPVADSKKRRRSVSNDSSSSSPERYRQLPKKSAAAAHERRRDSSSLSAVYADQPPAKIRHDRLNGKSDRRQEEGEKVGYNEDRQEKSFAEGKQKKGDDGRDKRAYDDGRGRKKKLCRGESIK